LYNYTILYSVFNIESFIKPILNILLVFDEKIKEEMYCSREQL